MLHYRGDLVLNGETLHYRGDLVLNGERCCIIGQI